MGSLQICAMMLALSAPGQTVLIDFRADYCGPCRQMDPIVHQLANAGYPVQTVNVDQNQAMAQQYRVTSIPCFVLLVDGKEVDRAVGGRDISTLEAMFTKVGAGPNGIRATSARNQAKADAAKSDTPALPTITMPGQVSPAPLKTDGRSTFASKSGNTNAQTDDTPRDRSLANNLIAATVRLRIEDGDGNSIGTGTIIDAREGMALVLTCGHLFRDSNGKGRVVAETFGPNGSQKVEGRTLTYDLKSDVGLLTIPVSGQVTVAHVATPDIQIAKGDRVISVGCNHGDDPTARESAVSNINRYQGSPNLQVAGQPVQGRSGGGLFNKDGQLIGVCNAADPADNEGLYAALAAVHTALDGAKLTFVYKTGAGNSQVASIRPSGGTAASAATFPKNDRVPASPAVFSQNAANDNRTASGDQEIILIIRPKNDPTAKGQMMVLDQPSAAFMQQLSSERPAQTAQQAAAFDAGPRDAVLRR